MVHRARWQMRSRSDRTSVRRPVRNIGALPDPAVPAERMEESPSEASSSVTLGYSRPAILRKTTSTSKKEKETTSGMRYIHLAKVYNEWKTYQESSLALRRSQYIHVIHPKYHLRHMVVGVVLLRVLIREVVDCMYSCCKLCCFCFLWSICCVFIHRIEIANKRTTSRMQPFVNHINRQWRHSIRKIQ